MSVDRLRRSLGHAFAVDPPGPAEPTPEQREAVEWVCQQIVKRHLSTPGLLFLEMMRPLNFISSQAMHFTQPGVWAVTPERTSEGWRHLAEYLEKRGSMEWIAARVEEMEQEARTEDARRRAASSPPSEPGATDEPDDTDRS